MSPILGALLTMKYTVKFRFSKIMFIIEINKVFDNLNISVTKKCIFLKFIGILIFLFNASSKNESQSPYTRLCWQKKLKVNQDKSILVCLIFYCEIYWSCFNFHYWLCCIFYIFQYLLLFEYVKLDNSFCYQVLVET